MHSKINSEHGATNGSDAVSLSEMPKDYVSLVAHAI
jgi:hypothetical protein